MASATFEKKADPLKGAYLQGIFPTFGGPNPDLEGLLQDTVN